MNELYALGLFDEEGNFIKYIRKGRSNSVVGYDNLSGAKRGIAHSKGNLSKERQHLIKIVKANNMEVVEI